MRLNEINGIGEKTEKIFYRAGIEKVEDLLTYYPRYYDTFEEPVLVRNLECDRTQAIYATVVRNVEVKRIRNLQIITGYLRDSEGSALRAVWFNSAYLKGKLHIGDTFVFRGFVKENRGGFEISQPKIYGIREYNKKMGEMQPVYSLVSGMTNNIVQKAIKQAFNLTEPTENIPKSVKEKFNLIDKSVAIKAIHYPKNYEDMRLARNRLIFDEFFYFIITLRNLKEKNDITVNENKLEEPKEITDLINNLPFKLTNAQLRTWNEIKEDIASDRVMNRLVQGDVGSGKTILAVLLVLTAALNGKQGAIMAPTEVLARQHFEFVTELIIKNNLNLNVAILVGSLTAKEKRLAYEKIESGETDIVIGTHAVIQEKVHFKDLAVAVTDEQHRFGVRQREMISEKGNHPHIMVMSATPIPRTLAIIMYGDLDISVIDELPAGRKPIANCVVGTEYRPKAYNFIEKQVDSGRQVYIICPTVEYSEAVEGENVIEYSEKLNKILHPGIKVEYLHGRMKPSEKNEIMGRFARNEIQVLVSTTVVEVGVNVPNATVMMVENAERFGLAQLHQLRGRVGRGEHQSYCIFIRGNKDQETAKRLEILNHSNDGFYIASEDLKLRGSGDLLGTRQSGDMEFQMADIFRDADILQKASEAASELLADDPYFEKPEHELLKKVMKSYLDLENHDIGL